METIKLYYTDSHLFSFEAQVISCREERGQWLVCLDQTAFFPEGGGQPGDSGFIGEARVLDVHERDGEILHYTDRELSVGERLCCVLDKEQRLRRMQNHSGEHLVSGLIHSKYGFENVGFHMGRDCMTIDLSGELTWQQLMETEGLANERIRENLPVRTWFPTAEELSRLEYRSKLELTENVRIVEMGDVDRCACCAPHVNYTGEIGIVKILDSVRHRGGVRVSLICGMDALDDYRLRQDSVTSVSRLLSAKRGEVAGAVERLLHEQELSKQRIADLSMELVRMRDDSVGETEGNICVFDSLLDEIAGRELVNLLMEKCGGIAALFSGEDGDYSYIIGSRNLDMRRAARELNPLINGRGGGKERMIQGRAAMGRAEILAAIDGFKG